MPQPLPRRSLLLALAAAACGHASPSWARELSDADLRAVRATIEAQLKAFAADDAVRAYSLAAPAIRSQFGSAQNFLAMVREAYPVVYRPASTAFFKPEWVDDTVRQVVQMRDSAGRTWLATYQLQRQPDKAWRISGCAVLPDEGKAT
jgi:hypothetical protein